MHPSQCTRVCRLACEAWAACPVACLLEAHQQSWCTCQTQTKLLLTRTSSIASCPWICHAPSSLRPKQQNCPVPSAPGSAGWRGKRAWHAPEHQVMSAQAAPHTVPTPLMAAQADRDIHNLPQVLPHCWPVPGSSRDQVLAHQVLQAGVGGVRGMPRSRGWPRRRLLASILLLISHT